MGESRLPSASRPAAPRAEAAPPAPAPKPASAPPAGRGRDALLRIAASLAAPREGVRVGAPDAPAEAAADAAAERVTSPGAAAGPVDARPLAFAQERPARALGAGEGEPLAAAEREFFEPRLGRGLAEARLHRGPVAERAAARVGARAFALGPDVFLGADADPASHEGRRILAHELAHVAADGGGEAVLRRVTLAQFRASLEATSADHKKVISELFTHPKFIPLITFLDNCPAGTLDYFVGHVTDLVGGVTVELFGGFNPGTPTSELSVNPFRAEHASNPLEMVDTIVHEVLHAIVTLGPGCTTAANLNPLTGTGITDAQADPQLTAYFAAGNTLNRASVVAASAAGVKTTGGEDVLNYLIRQYGPSASRPKSHFVDLNRPGLDLVTSIISDIHTKFPKIGKETVAFDNVEMSKAEALIPTRPWLNASQFDFSKKLFKDQVAAKRSVDPATYTDREYTISAIQAVEFADRKFFDDNAHGGWGPIGGVWECVKTSRFTGKTVKATVTGHSGAKPGGGTAYKIVQHS